MGPRLTEPVEWAGAAAAWLLGVVAVGPLVGGNPLSVAAQAVVEASPGAVATLAIETLGSAARPALVAAVGLFVVCLGAVAGLVEREIAPDGRRRRALLWVVGTGVVAATAWGYLAAGDPAPFRWVVATTLALAVPAALVRLGGERDSPVGRRRTLRSVGGTLGAALGAGLAARTFAPTNAGPGPDPGESLDTVGTETSDATASGTGDATAAGTSDTTEAGTVDPVATKTETGTTTPTTRTPAADTGAVQSRTVTDGVVVTTAGTDAAFGFDFEGMAPLVGDADSHYVVDKNGSPPSVDASEWTLSVQGAVEESPTFSLAELANHPDARDMTVTTVCISNRVGGGLIGTVEWRAVPLRSLLSEAGVSSQAVDVVTRAVDGYTEALPWSVVSDREDVVVAVGMDGETLPAEHGFPARLLIPGRYGMKSTKWVEAVEVSTGDHEAYWESRGWVEEAVVETLSYVRAVQRRGDRVAVGGIAYAGRRGVSRVEVSVDGGDTWADADLEDPPSEHARRRWRYVVERPDSGPMDVVVRATDGEGTVQTSEETDPHPGGSTGWHDATVSL